MEHEKYMQRCLALAARGLGNVAPNPMVGCVIVHNGEIVAEGYHQMYGGPHAEVNAIRAVAHEEKLRECTLYVNLEPCAHYGKTPPCTNLILEKKIQCVVIADNDPNPLVAGKGERQLLEHGVHLIKGILRDEHRFLNRRFITYHSQKRPYVILKWAQSADGWMAPPDNRQVWLSGEEARTLVHRWRAEEQAILVGKNTALTDNPQLTVRFADGRQPLRVVIDRNLEVPGHYNLYSPAAPTLIINAVKDKVDGHITFRRVCFESGFLREVMKILFEMQIQSVMVEGGPETLRHFVNGALWDEARVLISPVQLGSGRGVRLEGYTPSETKKVGSDTLQIYYRV
ncbi:MAG: bifunctional diaminohydroxyphosphoribosylaminopyrimidine deaminase/5-amino-6-(5-phosphoribosylamino)uracil reductase RibD [Chitinophagales bacterium]|nr:bifunctional diaminohydroxyphosphoribosylaminopyrimidine deaminase/5-amino-6-(5-phosphoribosylamino)uracil reductase RibD [Chitinophagales bacterium]MDW8419836.1 bifunctional diaminohydroxyphosphoribosylaminopyrimidine deaminase/5-amino-6-(5-phosphoribosylamino)uracil reductase RibD [Chitinophagales bacterium]